MAQPAPSKHFMRRDMTPYILVTAIALLIAVAVIFIWTAEDEDDDSENIYKVSLVALNDNENTAYPGRTTQFGLVISNEGNLTDEIMLEVRSRAPVVPTFVNPILNDKGQVVFETDKVYLKAGHSSALILDIFIPDEIERGKISIDVRARSNNNPLKSSFIWLDLNIEEPVDKEMCKVKDLVQVEYAGMRTNGLVFDTNIEAISTNEKLNRDSQVMSKTSFPPLKIYIGENDPDRGDDYVQVVEGFWHTTSEMREGETRVVLLEPDRAYGTESDPNNELAGKFLIFEIKLLAIDGNTDD